MNLVLASGALTEKTFWYPTFIGWGVVITGIVLFCGSVYLLLTTNIGARLGFLVAGAGLSGFMVVLTFLWMTTAYPLNTIKGRSPQWKVVEITSDIANAKTAIVRSIQNNAPVDASEQANIKAAVDEALVAKKKEGAVEPKPLSPVVTDWLKSSGYSIAESTDYVVVTGTDGTAFVYETPGTKPNPLSFEFSHPAQFAVLGICPADKLKAKADKPELVCDTSASAAPVQYVVLERDLGSLRVPPVAAFIVWTAVFGLFLLFLYWWETARRDESTVKGGVPVLVKKGS